VSLFLWFLVVIGGLGLFFTFWLIQKGYQMEREERRRDIGQDESGGEGSSRAR
jgi:hypothetical protein